MFWSVWFTVVFGSNAADALVSLGWLPESWPFVSGNAALIERSVAEYGLGHGTAAGLFAGVLVWQLLAAALFWRAAFEPEAASAGLAPRAASAFAVSLAFWGALLVADEVLVVYRHVDVTLVHWCIAIAEILCLLALRDPDARRPTP